METNLQDICVITDGCFNRRLVQANKQHKGNGPAVVLDESLPHFALNQSS